MLSRPKLLFLLLLVAGFLLVTQIGGNEANTAVAAPDTNTIPYTNHDLALNGDFAQGLKFWLKRGAGLNNALAEEGIGMDNSTAVRIFTESDTNFNTASAILQELYLPNQITDATLRFNVRIAQAFDGQPPQPGEAVNGWIAVVPLEANNNFDLNNAFVSGYVYEEAQGAFTDWATYEAPLPADALTALNNAHANKQRVALVIGTIANGWRFSLLVDDVSFRINGSRTVPNFTGEILYLGSREVRRVSPNGGPFQTVWQHPDETGARLYAARWNPTATEIAFTSNHETLYSNLGTDVYGIRLNGTQLRRITNAPSHADMQASELPRGTVRVQVTNAYNSTLDPVFPFFVYVQGAAGTASLSLPSQFGTAEVVIPDVVDLGAGGQYITFIYSSNACGANRRYVPSFVEVVGGQTVDIAVDFDGTGCGLSGGREASELTWKRDGSEIGFTITSTPFKISTINPSGPGAPWLSNGLVDSLAWSPTSNQVLYGFSTLGLYRNDTPDNTDSGVSVVPPQGGYPSQAAWLPDGSGFIYVESGNLFYATTQGTNIRQLTFFVGDFASYPSISPDGQYVVFEKDDQLWLMEWDNPTNLWPMGVEGAKPDWSRVNPSTPLPPPPPPATDFIYLPLITR